MPFPSRLTSFRPAWWGVFGLLVAVPAVVLAIVGLKAIDADAAERARQRRDQLAEVARLADAAIASALDRARAIAADTDATASGTLVFNLEPNGVLSFPRHRVYFGPFGLVPSAALSATAAGNIPEDIVASITASAAAPRRSGSQVADTLARLRAGAWWLSIDQRRVYDEALTRTLAKTERQAPPPDVELVRLTDVEPLVRSAGGSGGRRSGVDAVDRGGAVALVVWTPAGSASSMRGVWLDPSAVVTLLDTALEPLLERQAALAEVTDSRGARVWTSGADTGADHIEATSSAVAGWRVSVAFRNPAARSAQSWQAYGMVALPIAVLAFGLVMTTRLVRREVALARRQTDFTAAVTHEFKSPITSLRLLMERITSGRVSGGAALTGYHDAIARETDRLEGLVNRLLDVQQIQAGRRPHSPAPSSLAPLVEASVSRFRAQAEARGIELRVDLPADLPACPIDRTSLGDAIDNLIDNAIKYSPAGTTVDVVASAGRGGIALTVRDRGAGIHREDLPHVFEPYYRGTLGDSLSVRGTGLGLSLVQAAATAHGGTVDVTSVPGEGSCFTIRLPHGERP